MPRLVESGAEVVVLDSLRPDVHPPERPSEPLPGARLLVGDVREAGQVAQVLDGVDVVVHLAAKVGLGVDLGDLDDYVSSNGLGTAVLMQEMARAGVGRLVLASSMVVYGEGAYSCPEHGSVHPLARRDADLAAGRFEPGCPSCGRPLSPGLVSEDAGPDPRNGYAATKLHQEHLAAVWARETGGVAAALRFHNVYGPDFRSTRRTPVLPRCSRRRCVEARRRGSSRTASSGATSSMSMTSPPRWRRR